MKPTRAAGSILLISILVLCIWTAYANVFSDNKALLVRAEKLARDKAGCAEKCKITGIQGSRGMLTQTISHYIQGQGTFVVSCRRAYIAFGEYNCSVEKQ